jgi:hypothetical protein
MASNHSSPGAFASKTNSHHRTSSSESSASGSNKKQLRVEFQPCDYSVVCGRGRETFNHVGNRYFRILASTFIERYSQAGSKAGSTAGSKAAKSAIVSEIIAIIRQKAGRNFYKYERGAWFEVGDQYAREKVGALLRDLLHTQYRSSAKAKSSRRKILKQKEHQNRQSGQKQVGGTEDSVEGTEDSVEGTEDSVEGTEDSEDDSSTTSSCWGRSKDSLGFEYWLEESDNFFDIDVF